jgi:hypothetical protein
MSRNAGLLPAAGVMGIVAVKGQRVMKDNDMAAPYPLLLPAPDRRDPAAREALLQRIRTEFEELPGQRLTDRQARRLFDLPTEVCERILTALVRERTLTCGSDGRYRITDTQMWAARSTLLSRDLVRSSRAS